MNFHEELEKTGVIDVVSEIQNEMDSDTTNIDIEQIVEENEEEPKEEE